MNKEQKKQGEKIATNVLRTLAIIGFVAIVALAAWLFVQAVSSVPSLRDNLRAAVTTIRSIVQETPEESLVFDVETNTLAANDAMTLRWDYEGPEAPTTYNFSYACGSGASISLFLSNGWTDITCGEPVALENRNVTFVASNEVSRLSNVTFTVTANNVEDTITLSIVNTDIKEVFATNDISDTEPTDTQSSPDTTSNEVAEDDEQTTDPTENTTTTQPTTPAPTPTRVIERKVSRYNGPADLVVEIEQTGVLVEVRGENEFFPVSPIPSDKVAGVVFTVTNKGGETSEPWRFTAELPIEGDDDYEYTSPLQIPLASGMQITFTLGFDEVLEDSEGTIFIEIDPRDSADKTSNNTDSVSIDIKD